MPAVQKAHNQPSSRPESRITDQRLAYSNQNPWKSENIRNGSLRKRSSTARPKTRATHQHPNDVGGRVWYRGLTLLTQTRFVLGHLVARPKMGQITVPGLGLLKNGFSRNPGLKSEIFHDGPVNGPTSTVHRDPARPPELRPGSILLAPTSMGPRGSPPPTRRSAMRRTTTTTATTATSATTMAATSSPSPTRTSRTTSRGASSAVSTFPRGPACPRLVAERCSSRRTASDGPSHRWRKRA